MTRSTNLRGTPPPHAAMPEETSAPKPTTPVGRYNPMEAKRDEQRRQEVQAARRLLAEEDARLRRLAEARKLVADAEQDATAGD